jgi:ribosomal protein RSM22 (predicted rRNA methylase)
MTARARFACRTGVTSPSACRAREPHKQVKGAELPFEDEKFSFCVLSKQAVASRSSRVLAQPVVGKAKVAAKLCTADGLALIKVPRRDKKAYANARRWRWGDAVMGES